MLIIDTCHSHSGSIILKVVYGYETTAQQDDYVELANKAVKSLSRAVHVGSFLVDFFPVLKYVPGQSNGSRRTPFNFSSVIPWCRV